MHSVRPDTFMLCVADDSLELKMGTTKSFPMFKFTQLPPTQQAQCFGPGSFPDTALCAGKVITIHLQDIEKMAKPALDAIYDQWLQNQAEDKPALVLLDVPQSVFPSSDRDQVNIREKRSNPAEPATGFPPIPSALLYMASGIPADPPRSLTGDSSSTATSPVAAEIDDTVTLQFNQTDGPSGQSLARTQHIQDEHHPVDVHSDYGEMDLDFGGDADSDEYDTGTCNVPGPVPGMHAPGPTSTFPAVAIANCSLDVKSDYGELELEFGGDSSPEESGDDIIEMESSGPVTSGETENRSMPHVFTFGLRLPSPMTPAKALQRDPTPQFVSDGVPILRSTRKRTVMPARDRLPTLVSSHSATPTSRVKRAGMGIHNIPETQKQKGKTGVKPRPKAKFGGNSTVVSTAPMDLSLDDDPYNRGREERSKRHRM